MLPGLTLHHSISPPNLRTHDALVMAYPLPDAKGVVWLALVQPLRGPAASECGTVRALDDAEIAELERRALAAAKNTASEMTGQPLETQWQALSADVAAPALGLMYGALQKVSMEGLPDRLVKFLRNIEPIKEGPL